MRKKIFISTHAPKPHKPLSRDQFGHFLAGLIDSDGHISKDGYVQIDFDVNNRSLAYYVKHVIGYGSITREKSTMYVRYRCTYNQGLAVIADLTRHKLKHDDKIQQYNTRLVARLSKYNFTNAEFTVYTHSNLLHTHWCAGFIQGDGCLAIAQYNFKNTFKTLMCVNIHQKKPKLLELI